MIRTRLVLAACAAATLVSCGGGGGNSSGGAAPSGNASGGPDTFPTGVAVSSPLDLATSASVTQVSSIPATTFIADLGATTWAAIAQGDRARLAKVATAIAPIPRSYAAPMMLPEHARYAAIVEAIVNGAINPSGHIVWNDLLATSGNDPCFGPAVAYANHDDGGGAGVLPGGDVGIWKELAADGRPCAVAQLQQRARATRLKANQGLILAATMRKAVRDSALSMPNPGDTLDIRTPMTPIVQVANPNATVEVATIERSQTRNVWTYRLRVIDMTAGVRAEILLTHRPGSSATVHDGGMKVTVTSLTNDAALGCTDETGPGGLFKVAAVQTLRYGRNGNIINFSARHAHYCGHGDTSQTDLASTIAAFDANGELDPVVRLAGNVRGTSNGWRGNFSRFAGGFDRPTHAGNHIYAWQAGPGDSHSRMLAVTGTFNTVTEERTGKAFYGYANDIATTTGAMLGMICNWAGPGNMHVPNDRFQYQEVALSTAATAWSVVSSKIRYAPTNSCNSSPAMQFDVNADGSLAPGEGASVVNDLDSKGTSMSVATELSGRGFTIPSYY